MTRRIPAAGALVLLCLSGCPHNRYVIEMTPQGEFLQRKLTVTRVGGGAAPFPTTQPATRPGKPTTQKAAAAPLPEEELASIAKLYPQETTPPDGSGRSFVGKFKGALPADVGGWGSYLCWTTAMGSAHVYVERFRGEVNLGEQVQRRLRAADELTDLVAGWLSAALKGQRGVERLRRFLEAELHRDVRNISMLLWSAKVTLHERQDQGDTLLECALRGAQYLAERGYFDAKDIPRIARLLRDGARKDNGGTMAILRRLIASKMGVAPGEPIPAVLDFLADPEEARRSLARYVQTTDQFKTWRAKRQSAAGQTDQPAPAEPMAMLEALASTAFEFDLDLADSNDELEVSLVLGESLNSAQTNGRPDAKKRSLRWSGRLRPRGQSDHRFPRLCYAIWARPDADLQRARFGRVVLDGRALMEYCLWRKGLTQEEGKQWDRFLAGLRPDGSLAKKLEKFVFSHERDEETAGQLAETALQLIRNGLEARGARD